MSRPHTSVLGAAIAKLFVDQLSHLPLARVVDATIGAGGHSLLLFEAFKSTSCKLHITGVDQDASALEIAGQSLSQSLENPTSYDLHHCNFADFDGYQAANGILLDLGVSSMQLDQPERGFSFRNEGPLDMRMDQSKGVSARTIVNEWPVDLIGEVLKRYGDERNHRKIASQIMARREQKPLETTLDLVTAIAPVLDWKHSVRIHPATRTFQALRIAVNGEIGSLEKVLPVASKSLCTGGMLAVISFHSIEDSVVKNYFKNDPSLRVLKTKAITPCAVELANNQRSRSAKLRVAIKVEQ